MAQDKDQKTLNVPPLRFTGFTGDWKKTTLGEIGKTFNGLTGKNSNDFGQGSPYITYKSIFDNSKVDISRVEYVTITDNERIKSAQNVVRLGDIFFTTSSETPTEVGMTSVLLDGIEDCYLNSFCFGYRLSNKEETLPEYFRFYLRASVIRNKLSILAQGSTRFNISKNEVMRMGINLPNSSEQEKIAALLSCIDERITTQNKIIEKYESLIKGLNNILLYATGGKSVCLGDILLERSERSRTNNQHEVLSSTVKGIFSQREYFSKDIASENNVGYKIIRLHDVVLSPQNLWMGNINYNDRFEIGIVSPSYKVFSIADGYDNQFVAAMLKTHRALYSYMMVSEQGASIVRRNLNMEAFSQLVFKIPSLDKQREIGCAISLLKSQLKTANKIIRAYTSQKQYLLCQMFI